MRTGLRTTGYAAVALSQACRRHPSQTMTAAEALGRMCWLCLRGWVWRSIFGLCRAGRSCLVGRRWLLDVEGIGYNASVGEGLQGEARVGGKALANRDIDGIYRGDKEWLDVAIGDELQMKRGTILDVYF
jgi:hypothetical protein